MIVVDSVLARRNPTIKLALLFAVSIALFFTFDPVTPTVLYLVALGAILVTARIRPRVLVAAHLPFVGVALGLVIVNALSRPGSEVWSAGPLRITEEGLAVGGALAMRTLVIGLLSLAFIASTDGVRLMSSLHTHARLDVRITYAVLAGYRTLGDLPLEWRLIRQAQSVRAPLDRRGRPRGGLAFFARSAFALLVVSLRRAERMSVALEGRGLGLAPRTTWHPVPLTRTDWLFAAGVLAVLGAVFVVSAAAGVLRGAEAL